MPWRIPSAGWLKSATHSRRSKKEQERIRSNMGAVNNSSQYYSRLLEKLNAQETEIEKIQGEVRALEKKIDDQRTELEKYLANLSL